MISPTIGCDDNGNMIVIYEEIVQHADTNYYTDLKMLIHPLNGDWENPIMFYDTSENFGNATVLRPRIPRRINDAIPIVTFDILPLTKLADINGGIVGV